MKYAKSFDAALILFFNMSGRSNPSDHPTEDTVITHRTMTAAQQCDSAEDGLAIVHTALGITANEFLVSISGPEEGGWRMYAAAKDMKENAVAIMETYQSREHGPVELQSFSLVRFPPSIRDLLRPEPLKVAGGDNRLALSINKDSMDTAAVWLRLEATVKSLMATPFFDAAGNATLRATHNAIATI